MKPEAIDIEVAAAILRDTATQLGHPATAARLSRVADWLMSEMQAETNACTHPDDMTNPELTYCRGCKSSLVKERGD